MRYHLEIGKRRKEFIISFIIAKDYFSFPAFTSANNITIMFILRGEDSFAARILSLSARAKRGTIMIRVANESFALKMNIITIITHFQIYVLSQFAES